MYSDSFKKAVENTLNFEGGYVWNPKDPGGETNFGISKRAYPKLDIKNLTKDQAIAIYHRDYWQKIYGDSMPAALAFNVFDFAVNAGVGTAIKTLQKALFLSPDGVIGKGTLGAMQTASKSNLQNFASLRAQYYFSLKTFSTFGKGWINRTIGTLVKSL